ncbi:hypothetical protein FRC03_000132 [Tulasnella sp. 419]|nr:hypothetical protein FRC02_002937 [Tulasnella sp. 418]KAG8969886.1 hypothetical protein FRC03_000132 [Tulasnella sp. 419]
MVARCAIVDYRGQVIYDFFVQPTAEVTNYRTPTTGLESKHLQPGSALPFQQVQQDVARFIQGKIVVGYQLYKDFSVLGLSHQAIDTRDVGLFLPFRNALGAQDMVSLVKLVEQLMRRTIQAGYQNPVEDARAALDLFRSYEEEWERSIASGLWTCALPPPSFAPYLL